MVRLDLLYAHAADLCLEVEHADLGTRFGEWCRRRDGELFIRLNYRLTRAQMTTALAHEIGHYIRGDRCSTPAIERRADETGAALIITIKDYRAAERLAGEHPGALADELGVTPRLIVAWRRWYELRRVTR